jgi:hypothetical protein
MRLLFDYRKRPSGNWSVIDMPRLDKQSIIISIWFVYYLAKKCNVSKQSAFWHIFNHEILHVKNGHHPCKFKIKTQSDVQKYASCYKRTELDALPRAIDKETRILDKYMRRMIKNDIIRFHDNFKRSGSIY